MSTTLDGLVTILHPLKGASDQHSLIRTLQELEPSYVVLYDADMVLVRELEVSSHDNHKVSRAMFNSMSS